MGKWLSWRHTKSLSKLKKSRKRGYRPGIGYVRLTSFIVGIITVLVVSVVFSVYDDVGTRMLVLGILLALLISVVAHMAATVDRRIGKMEELSSRLADNDDLRNFYESTVYPLEEAYSNSDSCFRDFMEQQLREHLRPLHSYWREWKLKYEGEMWRSAYRQVLDQSDVREYKSIAWVKSKEYWQDPPGQESFRYNHELAKNKEKSVERIFLIRDSVWDSSDVKKMIREDRDAGIHVRVAREERVPIELRHDLGIYGNRAVGYQYTDDQSQTDHFDLIFNPDEIQIARTHYEGLERWSLTEQELEEYLEIGTPTE